MDGQEPPNLPPGTVLVKGSPISIVPFICFVASIMVVCDLPPVEVIVALCRRHAHGGIGLELNLPHQRRIGNIAVRGAVGDGNYFANRLKNFTATAMFLGQGAMIVIGWPVTGCGSTRLSAWTAGCEMSGRSL